MNNLLSVLNTNYTKKYTSLKETKNNFFIVIYYLHVKQRMIFNKKFIIWILDRSKIKVTFNVHFNNNNNLF